MNDFTSMVAGTPDDEYRGNRALRAIKERYLRRLLGEEEPDDPGLTQGPAAGAGPDPNSFAGVSAGAVERFPKLATREGRTYGGIRGPSFTARQGADGLIHTYRDHDDDPTTLAQAPERRSVNSIGSPPSADFDMAAARAEYERRQAEKQAKMQANRQGTIARNMGARAAQDYMSRIAGLHPGVQQEIVRAQSDAYGANIENGRRMQEDPIRRAMAAGNMMQGLENVPEAERGAYLDMIRGLVPGSVGPGAGMASVPTPEAIRERITAGRAASGVTDKDQLGALPSGDEIFAQISPEQAASMSREQILSMGFNEARLLGDIARLEEEAQRLTGFGQMISGADGRTPFGIGQRDPNDVRLAATALETANTMLNKLRQGT